MSLDIVLLIAWVGIALVLWRLAIVESAPDPADQRSVTPGVPATAIVCTRGRRPESQSRMGRSGTTMPPA